MVRPFLTKVGRWLNPTTLGLAVLCFVFPFVTVGCTPSGFGHAKSDGSTSYNGVDLIIGAEPKVAPPEKERPAEEAKDVRLYPQPAAAATLLLIVAAIGFALRQKDPRIRRGGVAVLSATALTALLVNQALSQSAVALLLADEYSGKTFPDGNTASDYVKGGSGFVFIMLLLLILTIGNTIAWWRRARDRPALVAGVERTELLP